MSLEKNKAGAARRRGVKRINLRITSLFSGLFAVTALLLLGGIYYTVKTSLDREDILFIQHKLLEFWAKSQTQSLDSFIDRLDGSAIELEGTPYFLRVADNENRTIFFMFPQGWKSFFPEDSFEEKLKPLGGILRISSARHSYTLLAGEIHLENDYLLQIGVSTQKTQQITGHIIRNFSMLLIPLLVISIIGGSFLTARMLAPIQKLSDTAGDIINTGNLKARIREVRAQDELYDLVTLFNRMLEHIETLVRSLQGTLDAVAHDLRTPLTRFRGMAELALQGPGDISAFREALQDGLEEAEKIITELNAIMDLSEAETGILKLDKTQADVVRIIRQIIEMYAYIGEERNIAIEFSGPDSLEAAVDTPRLRRVAGNLLDNAVKYSPAGGTIRVELSGESGWIVMRIRDTGPGIPRDELPHIWERLYRGSGAREKPGLGIGLSIAKAITQAHGGTISADTLPEGGAVFEVRLPAE
ncbi:MAG: HAMP domain-containing protein [Spirochaetales bacterium]|jgi:signal transduction histidine kinase|nr:HAMP domain-containing protein [Spirochaetales bacterium]